MQQESTTRRIERTGEKAKVDRLVQREKRREEVVRDRLSVSFEGFKSVRGEGCRD